MSFDDTLQLKFIEGIPGNAIVYLLIIEDDEIKDWTDEDWINTKNNYYKKVEDPQIAWLHDLFKNRCKYKIDLCLTKLKEIKNM